MILSKLNMLALTYKGVVLYADGKPMQVNRGPMILYYKLIYRVNESVVVLTSYKSKYTADVENEEYIRLPEFLEKLTISGQNIARVDELREVGGINLVTEAWLAEYNEIMTKVITTSEDLKRFEKFTKDNIITNIALASRYHFKRRRNNNNLVNRLKQHIPIALKLANFPNMLIDHQVFKTLYLEAGQTGLGRHKMIIPNDTFTGGLLKTAEGSESLGYYTTILCLQQTLGWTPRFWNAKNYAFVCKVLYHDILGNLNLLIYLDKDNNIFTRDEIQGNIDDYTTVDRLGLEISVGMGPKCKDPAGLYQAIVRYYEGAV